MLGAEPFFAQNVRFQQTLASGLQALALATELLHRVRLADAHAGIWEAADLQWWRRTPRASDELDQLFWLDRDGPLAAAILTDWKDAWGLDSIVVPNAPAAIRSEVWSAAVARIDALSLVNVETLVRDDDGAVAQLVRSLGFATEAHSFQTRMNAADRPTVPALPEGFELSDRLQSGDGPHPLVVRQGPTVEARLNEVPLYDPTLDLTIRAPTGDVAAYGLFWFDPATRVGLVEPMRTEGVWQRRGLARMLIATGLDRLTRRGATRLKVSFASDAARRLYLGVGFRVDAEMTTYARRFRP